MPSAATDASSNPRTTLGGLVGLVRPLNVFLSALGVAVGALAAAGTHPFAEPLPLLLAALVGLTGTAFGNVLNDLPTHPLDRIAHPERPLPSGRATRMAAWNLVLLLWITTILLAGLVNTSVLLLAVVLLALLFAYERALKRLGLVGNVAVAVAAGALFPLGALAYPEVARLKVPLLLGLIAAFAHLGRELLKDAEDVAADRAVRRTFAVRNGAAAAARLGALFLLTAVVVGPLPHFLGPWGDLYLVALVPPSLLFGVAAYRGRRDPAAGRALAKTAMVAALVAFLVGALT